MWTVPLLAVAIDRIVRSTGPPRWAWTASVTAIYVMVFMWFNAWMYRTSLRIHEQYPTYLDAFNAAIERMTQFDKLVAVGTHPLLFVVAAGLTIGLNRGITADDRHFHSQTDRRYGGWGLRPHVNVGCRQGGPGR